MNIISNTGTSYSISNSMSTQLCDIEDVEIEECPPDTRDAGTARVCEGCPGKELCLSQVSKPDPDQQVIDTRLRAIKHKILVLSGKGGVGKSSIAAMMSQILASDGHRVGLLDVDICGPSIPLLMGVVNQPILDSQWGWKPVVGAGESDGTIYGDYDEAAWHGQEGHPCPINYPLCAFTAHQVMDEYRKYVTNNETFV